MTQDNAYAFASFAAIGGHDYEGESFSSMRIFTDYESAVDYARGLVNGRFSYDYAYVSGIYPDGTMELKEVTRVADEEPSVVTLLIDARLGWPVGLVATKAPGGPQDRVY